MKKIMRRLFVVGGIILLVLVAFVLLVEKLVPTDTITDRIVTEVARATGAEVTLAEARIQWRGNWRVTLAEGSIAGTGAALAAATGSANDLESYAIAVSELSVVVALWPLLQKNLEVRAVTLSGPGLAVRWDHGEASAAGFKLRLTDLHLGLDNPLTAAAEKGAPPGKLIPGDLAFSFTAAADTLVLQNAPYTHLELEGGFAAKVLKVTSLSANRSTGRVTGDLSVDLTANPWGHLVFAAEVEEVPAKALLEPWLPDVASRLDCALNSDLTGEFDLRDNRVVMSTLMVSGRVDGGPGILHASDWLRDAGPYLGDRQDMMDVGFRDLVHQFEFSQGRYQFRELTLSGGDTEWTGGGWLDLEGNIALGIGVKLPPGFTPDLGNFSFLAEGLRDSAGRINLPLKLTGRAARPTVGVDFGRLRRK